MFIKIIGLTLMWKINLPPIENISRNFSETYNIQNIHVFSEEIPKQAYISFSTKICIRQSIFWQNKRPHVHVCVCVSFAPQSPASSPCQIRLRFMFERLLNIVLHKWQVLYKFSQYVGWLWICYDSTTSLRLCSLSRASHTHTHSQWLPHAKFAGAFRG
jgi:hypothetical protein